MRGNLKTFALFAVLACPAVAQAPPRPKVPASADTNDAEVYLAWGRSRLPKSPKDAAAAFYWASRIEPGRASAYYARWVALQLADPSRFEAHYERKKSTLASAEIQAIDSLELRALELSPLEFRDLDLLLVPIVYNGAPQTATTADPTGGGMGKSMSPRDSVPVASPGHMLAASGPGAVYHMPPPRSSDSYSQGGAWSSYARGNIPQAVYEYGAVLPGAKAKWAIYAERGRLFALAQSPDSALAQLALAIADFPHDSAHELTYVYESVAIYEHTRGLVNEILKLPDSARAAYQRALDADPSYAPAHLRLATLDLAQGDTAAALSHYDLAAQIRPRDGALAYEYGYLLIKSGHDAEALEQLERAAKLEPSYAAPRFLAAAVYDAHDMKPQASAAYAAFLAAASKRDPLTSKAKERLAALH